MSRIRSILLFISLSAPFLLHSQDVIILKDMRTISGKVVGLSDDSLIYMPDIQNPLKIQYIFRNEIRLIQFDEKLGSLAIDHNAGGGSIEHDLMNQQNKGGPSNAFLSLLYPGLGSYYVREERAPYWLIGLAAYGLVGGGIYYKMESDKLYDEYFNSPERELTTYDKANDYHHRFLIMTGAGAAIWLGDVIVTGIRGYRNTEKFKAKENTTLSRASFFMSNEGSLGLTWQF